jgi:hypothetical protein
MTIRQHARGAGMITGELVKRPAALDDALERFRDLPEKKITLACMKPCVRDLCFTASAGYA